MSLLTPGKVIRPEVTPDQVTALVRRLYGLTTTTIKELNSYDDKNFFIQVTGIADNPHLDDFYPNGYVLKILNSLDSKKEGIVEAQNQMMLFLAARGFHVPTPVKTVTGAYMSLRRISPDKDGPSRGKNLNVVRLLTFVPGKTLSQVPYTKQLFFECGAFIVNINCHLKDFHNEDLKLREFIWSLDKVLELTNFDYAVKDEANRELVQDVLRTWKEVVVPMLPKLERGFLHGDFNEHNILVRADPNSPASYHIQGVLDFGDVQHSCLVFELAIAIMYQMLGENLSIPITDVGGHLLAGYFTHRCLPDQEWDVLRECIGARFTQSLVMGAYTFQLDPTNLYLMSTSARGWQVLREFWHTPKQQVITRWKEIIHSYRSIQ